MNHDSSAITPPDAERVRAGDITWQRAKRRSLVQGAVRPVHIVKSSYSRRTLIGGRWFQVKVRSSSSRRAKTASSRPHAPAPATAGDAVRAGLQGALHQRPGRCARTGPSRPRAAGTAPQTTTGNPRWSCVEVAALADGRVAVRNSRHPAGPALVYTRAEIAAFPPGAKAGEFDDLA